MMALLWQAHHVKVLDVVSHKRANSPEGKALLAAASERLEAGKVALNQARKCAKASKPKAKAAVK